jgi:hypothetical protein
MTSRNSNSQKQFVKFCPIMSGEIETRCWRDACELWLPQLETCVIKALALRLIELSWRG